LQLLKRLWRPYDFDPNLDLYGGADRGISIGTSRNKNDENNGSCIVRLKAFADAKWLVEQATGLKIAGKPLRAMWAKPRRS